MSTAIAIGLGAGLGASLLLLTATLRGWRPHTRRSGESARRARQHAGARGRILPALLAAATVAAITRWPIMVAAVAVLVWAWPSMVGAGPASTRQIARLEAIAVWAESLRDTIAGSIGLEEAIRNSADAAPPAIKEPLGRLSSALTVHIPLPEALADFADDFDDESVDLVAAALTLNARLRGPGLVATLSALATSVREELDMRRRIEQDRRTLRRSARIIMGTAIGFAAFVAVFSRAYLAPYDTIAGQVVLALVIGVFVAGLVWMRRLAEPRRHERFLSHGHTHTRVAHSPVGATR
jgi:Flp pilus assembly protein TadB